MSSPVEELTSADDTREAHVDDAEEDVIRAEEREEGEEEGEGEGEEEGDGGEEENGTPEASTDDDEEAEDGSYHRELAMQVLQRGLTEEASSPSHRG